MTRPARLSDLLGNEDLIRLLTRGRVPPSSLFTGPEGVGKRTAGLLLAAFVNCKAPLPGDLCGECSSCLKAESGNHPDIWTYPPPGEASATIKIDMMRALNREAQYRPFEGKARFFIIDRVERMTHEAANSILKTLEEPPPTSHIILISAFPDQLLPTIRSRCQTFNFQALDRKGVERFLSSRTSLDRAEMRASFSGGSLGIALSLDLDALLEMRSGLLELMERWLGDPRFASVFEICEGKPLAGKLRNREQTAYLLDLLQTLCYDLYFIKVETIHRLVNLDVKPQLTKLAHGLSVGTIRDLLNSIAEAKRDLERNVSPTMCFETLWLTSQRKGLTPASPEA